MSAEMKCEAFPRAMRRYRPRFRGDIERERSGESQVCIDPYASFLDADLDADLDDDDDDLDDDDLDDDDDNLDDDDDLVDRDGGLPW